MGCVVRDPTFAALRTPALSPSPKASAVGESFSDSVRTEAIG
jgi:hypothetical protein